MSCVVCKNEGGFYVRPCLGCKRQQPLNKEHAEMLNLPEGIVVSDFIRQCIFREDIVAMNELFHKIRWTRHKVALQKKEGI